jgi:hypothetical protein
MGSGTGNEPGRTLSLTLSLMLSRTMSLMARLTMLSLTLHW